MDVISSTVSPKNLQRHFETLRYYNIDPARLFQIHATPPRERLLRTYASPFVGKMPLPVKRFFTDVMKRVRNPSKKLTLNYPLDFMENEVIVDEIVSLHARPWKGKKACVCICHDVDNKEGYDFIKQMVKMDLKKDVAATYFFLTHADYAIDQGLLLEIRDQGYEIAFHGDIHDQGLAFRPAHVMRERLRKGISALEGSRIQGFRSPALGVSPALFRQLKELRLRYDSSLQIASPFYPSVRLPYPFYLEEFDLWEIPLMVQDDNYFRDTQCSFDQALDSIQRFADEVIKLNGVFVLNMHPHLMAGRPEFYERLLDRLTGNKDLAFATMSEVVQMIDAGET